MKRIIILTLFKESIESYLNTSIIKNAIKNKIVEVEVIDFRTFSLDKHKKVDDYQYGGGAGMVLMLQPVVDAIRKYKTKNSRVILLSAQGATYNQTKANQLLNDYETLVLVCGHYEGFDERIVNYIDEVISVGDFILTGGELPAMIIADSVIRLIDNTISPESLSIESFENDLLDHDVYTKPIDFEGHKVPEVLLSGNHKEIDKYRLDSQIEKTKKNRPDLYKKYSKEKSQS